MPYFAKGKTDDDIGAELLAVLILLAFFLFAGGVAAGFILAGLWH